MAKLAVDIALLPPEEVMDAAIEANSNLTGQNMQGIILDTQGCLPHISLAMGVMEQSDLPGADDTLQKIASRNSPLKLEATRVAAKTIPSGETVSEFIIGNTPELQRLHEDLMVGLSGFLTHNATTNMLFGSDKADEFTPRWINNYPEHSAYKNFSPHITVGFGTTACKELPMQFTASQLALCHLGNWCTCREVLAVAELLR